MTKLFLVVSVRFFFCSAVSWCRFSTVAVIFHYFCKQNECLGKGLGLGFENRSVRCAGIGQGVFKTKTPEGPNEVTIIKSG